MHDPNEPYREARKASEAQALGRIAEAKSRAAAANARGDIITCSGCKAAGQSGDWGQGNCERLRCAGLCQRQVYANLTMARLIVELARIISSGAISDGVARSMLDELTHLQIDGTAGVGLLEYSDE